MFVEKGTKVFLWEVRFGEQSTPHLRFSDEGDREYPAREMIGSYRATVFHLQDTLNRCRPGEVVMDGYAEAHALNGPDVFSHYPFYYWFAETEDGWRQFIDAIAGYNDMNMSISSGYFPFVDGEGKIVVPDFDGVSICRWHDMAYRDTSTHGCDLCFVEMTSPVGGHDMRAKRRAREAFYKMTPQYITT